MDNQIKYRISCDTQGSVFCLSADNEQYNRHDIIVYPLNCDRKKYLLEHFMIDYESFYKIAASRGVNKEYAALNNPDAVIEFLAGL